MEWSRAVEEALEYIEAHITDDLTAGMLARNAGISPYYFQKGFAMLCGYTVGEYIRMRRLSLAAEELLSTECRIIDLAVKYGYDSPDSFTKAFVRFHGLTPREARRKGASLRCLAPLHISLILQGGKVMEYRIETKPGFKVMGVTRTFSYETAMMEIPAFWNELQEMEKRPVCGVYGICLDDDGQGGRFHYMIAEEYDAEKAQCNNLETAEIPVHTWLVVPCRGAMPDSIQQANRRLFSELLPGSSYVIADDCNIEYYSDPAGFAKGTQDPAYYSEVWVPVSEKSR